ncbi:MAG: hypothetical protein GY715_13005 [Planctomycetes bacterium]|nr:hypothetical protein [Planctomycetota bacterium]
MKHLFRYFWHGESVGRRLGSGVGSALIVIVAALEASPAPAWADLQNPLTIVLAVAALFTGALSDKENGSK